MVSAPVSPVVNALIVGGELRRTTIAEGEEDIVRGDRKTLEVISYICR
jgi:hypothetical protein